MDLFTKQDLQILLNPPASPCISIYLPTHRGGAEQDPIRWKNLLRNVEEQLLGRGMRPAAAVELLAPAREKESDAAFWNSQSDGLAYFQAPDLTRCYRLPLSFSESAGVGEGFHVKPLLPLLSGNGRFFVLALSQKAVRLLQGTGHSISEVDLKGVPQNLAEALLAHEDMEPFSFVGRRAGNGAGSWGGIFHGHGVGIDDPKDELLHYFQKIDRGLHPLLGEEQAPLILASVEYLWPLYREANTYPHLLPTGVAGNPDHLTARELHDRAWPLVQRCFAEAQGKAVALYARFAGTGRTSDDLAEVVAAAHKGQVEILLAARDDDRLGAFDAASGAVAVHPAPLNGDVELVNLAVAGVLRHGGTVHLIEPDKVPAEVRLPAAVYWRPHCQKKVG